MSRVNLQNKQIEKEREDILKEINELKKNEVIKRFYELQNKNIKLANEQITLYKKLKVKEYDSCNHIWVNTLHDYDSCEGRSDDYYGCIKCGLDQRVFEISSRLGSIDFLTLEQQTMYEYMYGRYVIYKGINTYIECDLDLARNFYAKLKEENKNINDEQVIDLLKNNLKLVKKK